MSSMPAYPVGDPEPAPRPEPPSSVRQAVRLMQAGAALSLLALVGTLTSLGSLKERIRDQLVAQDQPATEAVINASYVSAIVASVAFALIGVGLWLWMAWKNGQGRSWARVVATVLGALNIVSRLYALTVGGLGGIGVALALLTVLLAGAILFLLWRQESSEFFAARSAAQQRG